MVKLQRRMSPCGAKRTIARQISEGSLLSVDVRLFCQTLQS